MVNRETESLLIEGARVVTPDGVREDLSLFIEDSSIRRIFTPDEGKTVRAYRTLSLRNLTLFPGFIDIHTHGAVGVDVMTATRSELQSAGQYLAAHGVTAWLPTLVPGPPEDYLRATREIDELISVQDASSEGIAARALGLHYEGPFVSRKQCGALRTPFFRAFGGASDIDSLPRLHTPAAIHMMTLAPEIEGGIELIGELRRRGWVASIGHTRADTAILDRAFEAGARHMTHFFNAMPPLHHRAPGPVGWGLARDEVTIDLIADGIHVDPLVLKAILRAKGAHSLCLISDSVAPAGMGDGRFHLWNEIITVKDGRTENEGGHIAGSVINISDAVRLMRRLGVCANDLALMASHNPAKLLGVTDNYGTIEEGKRADMVALDEDYSVRLLIMGGRVLDNS